MGRSLLCSAKPPILGLLLVGTLVSAAEANSRKFYLTDDSFTGGQALTACAKGYHMASLWEIFNVGTLTYDTKLGFTREDGSSGPPSQTAGWVRTGFDSSNNPNAGLGNCLAWTSSAAGDKGTLVQLGDLWGASSVAISPWDPLVRTCDFHNPVWSVSNK